MARCETQDKLIEKILDVLLLEPAPWHNQALLLEVNLHHLQKILWE